MKDVPQWRPSGTAARTALTASAVSVAALLLLPLATLGRGFDADSLLLHLGGGVLNLTGSTPAHLPDTGTVLTLALVTLALLLVSAVGAARRAVWLWVPALLAGLSAVLAVTLLRRGIDAEAARALADTTLRPGAKVQLRNFYESSGMNLGLFVPILGALVATGAGLSAQPAWWARLNRLRGLLVPAVAIALAMGVGALVVLIVQPVVNNAGQPLGAWQTWLAKSDLVYFVYSTLFAPITRLNPLLDSLKIATPLIFTGLSVAFAFRAGLFNIGAPGQLTMGAVAAMLVGVYAPAGLGWALLPLSIAAAGAGGALWGAVPGVLKARFGSSEVINTIMLNYVASAIFVFMIGTDRFPLFGKTYDLPFKAEGYEPRSEELQAAARLPTMVDLLNVGAGGSVALSIGLPVALAALYVLRRVLKGRSRGVGALVGAAALGALTWRVGVPVTVVGSQFNASFLLALAGAALFGTLMWRTAAGYALRAVGLSPRAAEYGGISVARNTVLAMTLAGMFAGLAGTHYVNGGALDEYRLKGNMPASVGFDGIAVALMGQNTPAGVMASSVLFGTIDTGSVDVTTKLDKVDSNIVRVLKALIVLFIAAGGFLSRRVTDPPPPALASGDAGHAETLSAPAPGAAPAQPNVAQNVHHAPTETTAPQTSKDEDRA